MTTAQRTDAGTVAGEKTRRSESGSSGNLPGTAVDETTAANEKGSELATASYVVPTISCPSCAARVEANAEKDPGVVGVRVEFQNVIVSYDPKKTDPERIASAIREGGDKVVPQHE